MLSAIVFVSIFLTILVFLGIIFAESEVDIKEFKRWSSSDFGTFLLLGVFLPPLAFIFLLRDLKHTSISMWVGAIIGVSLLSIGLIGSGVDCSFRSGSYIPNCED